MTDKTIKEDELFVLAEYSHDKAEHSVFSNYSYWKSTVVTFTKNKFAMAMLVLMIALVVFSIIQPYLPNQLDPNRSEYLTKLKMWKNPPSAKHWFGTDAVGRDMWSRVWYGTRISLSMAMIVALVETFVGVLVGLLWGYLKQMDRIMTEVYNVLANIPGTLLLILMAYIMSPGYWTLIFAFVVRGWIGMAKYIRNMTMIIRDREYNMASKCLGTPVWRMMTKNLLPFLVSVILLSLALSIPSVISAEIILTYLGVGLPVTVPSLGVLINTGQSVFTMYPHLLIYPSIVVSLITISFYVVGNAFSDASDPKNHI